MTPNPDTERIARELGWKIYAGDSWIKPESGESGRMRILDPEIRDALISRTLELERIRELSANELDSHELARESLRRERDTALAERDRANEKLADLAGTFRAINNERKQAEAERDELRKALEEIIAEADQSNGGKGAQLPIVLYMRKMAVEVIIRQRRRAALGEGVEGKK